MNAFKKIAESKEWKDRLAGYHKWRVYIPKCRTCGRSNTSYTLHGTQADVEKFAGNSECDHCDKCS